MDPDGTAFFLNGTIPDLSGFGSPFGQTTPLGQGLKKPLLLAICFPDPDSYKRFNKTNSQGVIRIAG